MRERTCPTCYLPERDHAHGCPESWTSDENRRVEREVIPAVCHVGGQVICDHADHKVYAR